jgi:hypothetical protein
MKKLLALVTVLVFMCGMLASFTVTVSAEEYYTSGDFMYTILEDGTAEITTYTGVAKEIEIPAEIDGYSITAIGYNAFYSLNDGSYISITIPDSVTLIRQWAFSDSALTSIKVDENNKTFSDIDGVLFNKEVTEIIQFPEGRTDTEYTIPNTVNLIGESAFEDCNNLISVTIPDSVTTIGDNAFRFCNNLTSIIIPDSVTLIGSNAFPFKSGNYEYSILSDRTAEITDYMGEETELVIPAEIDGYTVTSIGFYAFTNGDSLISITIPDSVTSIRDYAFSDCDNLTSIIIPDSVTSIGEGAFHYCLQLTSIEISDSVISIGDYAFEECDNLTSITVSENNINYSSLDGVFFNKDKTELIKYPEGKIGDEYTIPDSVTSLLGWAFYDCDSLTSITIPDSVTSIEKFAFQNCSALTSITLPDSITSVVHILRNNLIRGCKG